MKIICTLNLKGGCAKTTTAVSMAELLATGFKSKRGTVKPGKVLLFDNDKQGNANVKVSAEEVESYDIEECTAILNAYMEFVDELKANPN